MKEPQSDIMYFIEKEIPNTYEIITTKINIIGYLMLEQRTHKFVFVPVKKDKLFLKAWHLFTIGNKINELNKKGEI